jgi:hypothetical protein
MVCLGPSYAEGASSMNLQAFPLPSAKQFIGSVRRFGPNGVLYQVLDILDPQTARIRVLDTGEETPYPLAHIAADPVD